MNRILLDCTALDGSFTGLSTYIIGLLSQLTKAKYERQTFTLLITNSGLSFLQDNGVDLKAFSIWLVNHQSYGITRELFFLIHYKKFYNFNAYHCLHSYAPFVNIPTRKVVTIHDLKYIEYPSYLGRFKSLIIRKYIENSYENADIIITISYFTKESLKKVFGEVDDSKIYVIYHGCNVSDDVPSIQSPSGKSDYILFVGENRAHKNVARLEDSISLIDGLELKIIGKGFNEKLSTERVKYYSQVSFNELISYIKNARVFVFPSLYEGFGLPIIEAMKLMTPVVTSDGTACSEIAKDFAEKVNPYSTESIVEGIFKACEYSALKKNQAKCYAEGFTWERCAKSHIYVYGVANEIN